MVFIITTRRIGRNKKDIEKRPVKARPCGTPFDPQKLPAGVKSFHLEVVKREAVSGWAIWRKEKNVG